MRNHHYALGAALLFTTAYLLVSALGLWCSYWFYRGFGVSILDYLQASDFLVAGVRDPVYIGLLLLGTYLALLWVSARQPVLEEG